MADGLRIRPLREEETPELARLWRRARDEAQPWLEERMGYSAADDLRQLRDVVAPRCDMWVADRDGRALGFLAIEGELLDQLYVDPPEQRRGVGTALLRKAQELRPAGFHLYTHQRNAGARAFYDHHGLAAVAFGMSPPPESEPDVKYVWEPEPEPER